MKWSLLDSRHAHRSTAYYIPLKEKKNTPTMLSIHLLRKILYRWISSPPLPQIQVQAHLVSTCCKTNKQRNKRDAFGLITNPKTFKKQWQTKAALNLTHYPSTICCTMSGWHYNTKEVGVGKNGDYAETEGGRQNWMRKLDHLPILLNKCKAV